MQKIKELIKKVNESDLKTLESYRMILFIVVVVDVLLVYWYLNLKQVGIALLLVSLALLGWIVYLIGNKEPKSPKPMQTKEKTVPEDKQESFLDSIGFPDSVEYNKRVERALGTI